MAKQWNRVQHGHFTLIASVNCFAKGVVQVLCSLSCRAVVLDRFRT